MSAAPRQLSADTIRVIVRVTLFTAACWIVWRLMPFLMPPGTNRLVVATLSSFAAGAFANGLLVRMYEESRLSAFGMAWGTSSGREMLIGLAGGAGSAAAICAFALITHMARLELAPPSPGSSLVGSVSNVLFVLVLIAFGAVGEELMFRGYAFQLLVRTMGEFAAVLPTAVIFGVAHMGNHDVTALAIFNTVGWGILLGYAFLITRALWLPIGLHFGWNAAMPLLGANLSGITMGIHYSLHWSASDWLSGGAYGFEGGVLATVAAVALFPILRRAIPVRDSERA